MKKNIVISSILGLLFCSLSSCFQQIYTRRSAANPDSAAIVNSISSKQVIFLHDSSGNAFVLANVALQKDTVSGRVQDLTKEYYQYIDVADSNAKYRGKRVEQVRGKLHLYTRNSVKPGQDIHLALNSFRRMDSYQYNKKATTGEQITSAAGILVGIVLVFAVANAAANSMTINLGR